VDLLKELGAEIHDCLSEKVTHYICSNADERKIAVAKLMNIHVVSPLWVERCIQTRSKQLEKDFLLDYDLLPFLQRNIHLFTASLRDENNGSSSCPSSSSSCSSAQSLPEPKPVSVLLPKFKEFILPPIDDTVLTRRRSERLIDLDEDDDEDEDETESDNDEIASRESKKSELSSRRCDKLQSIPRRLKKSSLEDTMAISPKKTLPIVYIDEPSEQTWKHFQANLATDYVIDGNGPTTVRGAGSRSGLYFKKKKKLMVQRAVYSNSSSRRGRLSRSERSESEEEEEGSYSGSDDSSETGDSSDEDASFRMKSKKERNENKSQIKRKKKAKRPYPLPGSGKSGLKTGNRKIKTDIVAKANEQTNKIVFCFSGFNQHKAELQALVSAVQSLLAVLKNAQPLTSTGISTDVANSSDLPTETEPCTSSSSSSMSSFSSVLIDPYEVDVGTLENNRSYKAEYSFLIVSKFNKR
jgi:hypothetical protein